MTLSATYVRIPHLTEQIHYSGGAITTTGFRFCGIWPSIYSQHQLAVLRMSVGLALQATYLTKSVGTLKTTLLRRTSALKAGLSKILLIRQWAKQQQHYGSEQSNKTFRRRFATSY